MVPTSAHSGDGMGNLIALLCEIAQTMLAKRIMYSEELQATVMEVGQNYFHILISSSLTEVINTNAMFSQSSHTSLKVFEFI